MFKDKLELDHLGVWTWTLNLECWNIKKLKKMSHQLDFLGKKRQELDKARDSPLSGGPWDFRINSVHQPDLVHVYMSHYAQESPITLVADRLNTKIPKHKCQYLNSM